MGLGPSSAVTNLLVIMAVRLVVLICVVLASAPAFANSQPTIEIRGNRAFTAEVIRAYIEAQQPTLIEPSGAISQEAIERATLLVSAYYWDHGYATVNVGEAVIDHASHRVTFTIKSEGPKFRIGSVAVTGDLLRTERTFVASLATKPGAMFSRTTIANDRQKLQRFYEDRAYAYANVLPLTKVDLDKWTIVLTFEITRGELCFIEKLSIVGNTRTSTQDILDQLSVKQGDAFHGSRLEASRKRLRASGKFNDVWLATKRGSSDSAIEVIVEVDE